MDLFVIIGFYVLPWFLMFLREGLELVAGRVTLGRVRSGAKARGDPKARRRQRVRRPNWFQRMQSVGAVPLSFCGFQLFMGSVRASGGAALPRDTEAERLMVWAILAAVSCWSYYHFAVFGRRFQLMTWTHRGVASIPPPSRRRLYGWAFTLVFIPWTAIYSLLLSHGRV